MNLESTYRALIAYACSRGDQEFSVSQDRLLFWFESQRNYLISRRTLSRHLMRLQELGRVRVEYDFKTGQSIFRFPDGVVTRQRVAFVPASALGVFSIEDGGAEVLHGGVPVGFPPGLLADDLPF